MKRAILACSLLLLFSLPLEAVEIAPEQTAGRRVQRAFTNIALSPFELTTELAREKAKTGKKGQWEPSWAKGIAVGTLKSAGRAFRGAVELITAPIPTPPNFEWKTEREFAWELLESPKPAENP
ncbi:MAG: hypothetical protein ACOY3K_03980 [Candidatus Omnitrophota bacterium]